MKFSNHLQQLLPIQILGSNGPEQFLLLFLLLFVFNCTLLLLQICIVNGMGIPDRRLHDLRHTFAVVSIENGDDIKTVQGNLGHSSASFTLDVYGHISDAMRSASSERMDNFLNDLRKDPDPTPPEEDTEKALLENEESSNIITFSSYFPNNIYTEQAK